MSAPHVRTMALALCAITIFTACDDDDGDGTGNDDDAVALEQVASGLTSPVALVSAPGSNLRFIVDQAGTIRILRTDGTLVPTPFLDLRSKMVTLNAQYDERGVLGLAFHPNYQTNKKFYVFYSVPLRLLGPLGWNHTARISEFLVSSNAEVADAGSERIVLEIDKPQSNHNGGTLAFGPDNNLYISVGDGGAANDLGTGHMDDWYTGNGGGNAQNRETLLGKILRIDVNGTPYSIPSDNPFVNASGRDEIYAYGFRNPYRFSFDSQGSRDLLVGDAGQNRYEEVSRVVKGGNYGWNVFEGAHCFDAEAPDSNPTGCPQTDPTTNTVLTPPVIEYPQAKLTGGLGVVVVGGYVYRGDDVEALEGKYVFGDFTRTLDPSPSPDGSIFVATPTASSPWAFEQLLFDGNRLGDYLLGFGQDADGELYVLVTDNLGPTGTTGRVFKLVD
jgi:glucose/arabinose dehydrogenase